jgi:hypothetical protein
MAGQKGNFRIISFHDRGADRNAALALDRHPVRARPQPVAARLDLDQLIAPPNSSSFSVKVVLPASGCEMIANVRRRAISSVRLLINPLRLLPRWGPPLLLLPPRRHRQWI